MRQAITLLIHNYIAFVSYCVVRTGDYNNIHTRRLSQNSASHHYCVFGLRNSLILYNLIFHLSLLWHFHIIRIFWSFFLAGSIGSLLSGFLVSKDTEKHQTKSRFSFGDCAVRTVF